MDTPFGTPLTQYLNPVPNELAPPPPPNKTRSERRCSSDKAFIGHGGRGGLGVYLNMISATLRCVCCGLASPPPPPLPQPPGSCPQTSPGISSTVSDVEGFGMTGH